ncbi:uncharacterized protein FAM241A isoform X2 [Myotis lucifugus]|uniref:uncharacterized protein FAM241A isoform X2 n=1 Tax=Myotis lucifugus TaxID=59463 RepID=UPI0006D73633|nr:uncharacterized protein FAM241A isoform X2 [Myotis lucifugus]
MLAMLLEMTTKRWEHFLEPPLSLASWLGPEIISRTYLAHLFPGPLLPRGKGGTGMHRAPRRWTVDLVRRGVSPQDCLDWKQVFYSQENKK